MGDHHQFLDVLLVVFLEMRLCQLGLVPCVLGQSYFLAHLLVPIVAKNLLWNQIVAG